MTTGLGIATIPARPAESVGARSVSGVTQERMPLFRCGPPAQRPQSMPVARPLPIACMLRLTPAAFVRRSARQPCAIGRVKLDDGPWSHLAARSECKEIPVSLPQFSRIAETAAKLASDLLPCCAARRWAGRSAFVRTITTNGRTRCSAGGCEEFPRRCPPGPFACGEVTPGQWPHFRAASCVAVLFQFRSCKALNEPILCSCVRNRTLARPRSLTSLTLSRLQRPVAGALHPTHPHRAPGRRRLRHCAVSR